MQRSWQWLLWVVVQIAHVVRTAVGKWMYPAFEPPPDIPSDSDAIERGVPLFACTEGIEFEEGDMSPSDSKMLREGIRRWQTVREEVAAVEDAAAGYGETVRLYHALRKAWIFHVRRRWWRRPPSVAFPPKIVVCQNRTLIGITSAKTWVRDVDSDRTGRVTLSARTPPFF